MPTESLLIVGRSSGVAGNKSSRNRKKILRRRSSGGADILNPVLTEESSFSGWTAPQTQLEEQQQQAAKEEVKGEMKHSLSWFRLRREGSVRRAADKEALLSRRRGSLPIEVLAVGHSGELSRAGNGHGDTFIIPFSNYQELCATEMSCWRRTTREVEKNVDFRISTWMFEDWTSGV